MRIALACLACLAGLAAAAPAAAAPPTLRDLILKPAQVGKGYVLLARRDGNGVKAARTLDLCGVKDYPSEKLRSGRLQVDYLKRKTATGLSNEIVAYRPGGTAQAMREVTAHALRCPKGKVDPGEQGLPPLTFRITRLTATGLLKGYLFVRVRVTGTVKGKHVDQTSYAVYQRLGNVLSGVYSFGPNTPAQQLFCLHAAQQSARNLRLGGTGGKGPTA